MCSMINQSKIGKKKKNIQNSVAPAAASSEKDEDSDSDSEL